MGDLSQVRGGCTSSSPGNLLRLDIFTFLTLVVTNVARGNWTCCGTAERLMDLFLRYHPRKTMNVWADDLN